MSREIVHPEQSEQLAEILKNLANLLNVSKLKGKTVAEVTEQVRQQLHNLGEHIYERLKDADDIASQGHTILTAIEKGLEEILIWNTNCLVLDKIWHEISRNDQHDNGNNEKILLGFSYVCWAKGFTQMIAPGAEWQREKLASMQAQIHSKFDKKLQEIVRKKHIVKCDVQSINGAIIEESKKCEDAKQARGDADRKATSGHAQSITLKEAFVQDAYSAIELVNSVTPGPGFYDKKNITNEEPEHIVEIVKQQCDVGVEKLMSLSNEKNQEREKAQAQFGLHRKNMLSSTISKIALEQTLKHVEQGLQQGKIIDEVDEKTPSDDGLTQTKEKIAELESTLKNTEDKVGRLDKQLKDLKEDRKKHETAIRTSDKIGSVARDWFSRWGSDDTDILTRISEELLFENEQLVKYERALSELENKTNEDVSKDFKLDELTAYEAENKNIEETLKKSEIEKTDDKIALKYDEKEKTKCATYLLQIEKVLTDITLDFQSRNNQIIFKKGLDFIWPSKKPKNDNNPQSEPQPKNVSLEMAQKNPIDWPKAEKKFDVPVHPNKRSINSKHNHKNTATISNPESGKTLRDKICKDKGVSYGNDKDFLESERAHIISKIAELRKAIEIKEEAIKNHQNL